MKLNFKITDTEEKSANVQMSTRRIQSVKKSNQISIFFLRFSELKKYASFPGDWVNKKKKFKLFWFHPFNNEANSYW